MISEKKIIWVAIALIIILLLFMALNNYSPTPSGFYDTIDGLNGIRIK